VQLKRRCNKDDERWYEGGVKNKEARGTCRYSFTLRRERRSEKYLAVVDYILSKFRLSSDCQKEMARKFFVGGNWKMNGTKSEINDIVSFLKTGPLDPNVGT